MPKELRERITSDVLCVVLHSDRFIYEYGELQVRTVNSSWFAGGD